MCIEQRRYTVLIYIQGFCMQTETQNGRNIHDDYHYIHWEMTLVSYIAPPNQTARGAVFMFYSLSWEIIVHFVNIGGTVIHHSLNFLREINSDQNYCNRMSNSVYKGNNKITELRTILQRESQNS